MAAYAVGFYTMWDHSFRTSYGEQTVKLVEKHGGRFLVRPACRWEVLEGEPPRPDPGMVLIEFPLVRPRRPGITTLSTSPSSSCGSRVHDST